MSKGITKGYRFKDFFRLCMFSIISCTLLLGGMLLNPRPVQAIPTFAPFPTTMTAHVGQNFSYSFLITGAPYCSSPTHHWELWNSAPPWLSLVSSTGNPGIVKGTPTTVGTFVFQVRCHETGSGCGPSYVKGTGFNAANWTPVITINVLPASTGPTYAPYPLSMTACVGQNFSYSFLIVGTPYCSSPTHHWELWNTAPVWLSLVSSTGNPGIVQGVPTAPGTFVFQVRCHETGSGCGPSYIKDFQTTITNWTPPIIITVQDCSTPPPPPPPPPTSTAFNYTVNIGSGLGAAVVPVSVDGQVYASMAGGETKTFTGNVGQSYSVSVPDTVSGAPGTRLKIQGAAAKTANESNIAVSFNYLPEYQVDFRADPPGVAQLPGSNWYPAGTQVNSTAPELVTSAVEKKEYVFTQWNLPDGGKSLSKNLAFTINGPGTYYAVYTSRSAAPNVGTKDNTLMWIAIIVGIVAAAAVVIVILTRRRGTGGTTSK